MRGEPLFSRDVFRRNSAGNWIFKKKATFRGAIVEGYHEPGTVVTDDMLPDDYTTDDIPDLRFKGNFSEDGSVILTVD